MDSNEQHKKQTAKVDDRFVANWHPKYDDFWHDEEDYQDILKNVRAEIEKMGSIKKDTFEKIYKWKAPRSWHLVEFDKYSIYEYVIRKIVEEDPKRKLPNLVVLPGVAVPTGSTILHFIFPDNYPIMDMHTISALEDLYGINIISPPTHVEYSRFRKRVMDIFDELNNWNLRHLDRALMAYDKTKN